MIPSTDMLNAFHQNALISRPEGKRLTQLEQEMANILSRTDLSDRQKMEQFGYTIQKFQKIRGDIVEKGGFMMTPEKNLPDPAEGISQKVFEKIQGIIQQAIQADSAPAAINIPGPSASSQSHTTPTPSATARTKKLKTKRLYAQQPKKKNVQHAKKTKSRRKEIEAQDEDGGDYDDEDDQQDENSPLISTTPQGASAAAPKKGILARSKEALRSVFSPMRTRAASAAKFANSSVNFSAWDRRQ